ncbi:unnamed protein product, partial [Ectocarpus sp. 12 AP-2014]
AIPASHPSTSLLRLRQHGGSCCFCCCCCCCCCSCCCLSLSLLLLLLAVAACCCHIQCVSRCVLILLGIIPFAISPARRLLLLLLLPDAFTSRFFFFHTLLYTLLFSKRAHLVIRMSRLVLSDNDCRG